MRKHWKRSKAEMFHGKETSSALQQFHALAHRMADESLSWGSRGQSSPLLISKKA
jgi:hypothetical protein